MGIKALCALELRNLLGWNVFRHTRDPKQRRKWLLMAPVWALLIVMILLYSGGLSWGLTALGLGQTVPAYLTAIASLALFFFGIFQAGGTVFRQEGYEILCSLPVSPAAVVLSRFLRMYLGNLSVAAVVMVPGLAVYARILRPGWAACLLGLAGILIVPLIPMAAATFLGAAVTAVSSRMKHKSLVSAALSVAAVLAILAFTSQSYRLEDVSEEMLRELSGAVLSVLGRLYPFAVWLGSAIGEGNVPLWLGCAGLSLAAAAAAVGIVSMGFRKICGRLFGTSAKHNYRLTQLQKGSLLMSLCRRELRRYFSSGIYVTNTILGPVLGTVLSAALLLGGKDFLETALPLPIDLSGLVPFLLAGIFCLMTAASVSISMEGKSWWIVKSLPLSTKSILDGKLLANLVLILPFYLVSEVLLFFALTPSLGQLLFLVFFPACMILFSCVFGIAVNLRLPLMTWESEVSVVKQSASAMLGGMGGFLLSLLCAGVVMAVPRGMSLPIRAALPVLLLLASAALYGSCIRTDLRKI